MGRAAQRERVRRTDEIFVRMNIDGSCRSAGTLQVFIVQAARSRATSQAVGQIHQKQTFRPCRLRDAKFKFSGASHSAGRSDRPPLLPRQPQAPIRSQMSQSATLGLRAPRTEWI